MKGSITPFEVADPRCRVSGIPDPLLGSDAVRTEDGYIIQQCLDGNAAAFGLLVEKYKKGIYALAYSEIHNFHDAQDITQEAFIKAYGKLRTLRRWDNFMGWLYRITSNLCKDWLRSSSRRPDGEFVEDHGPGVIDHSSVDSYRENVMYESVREALDSLPEIYREVLALRYFGGMTIKEISRFLGVSPGTIDRRLSGALTRLKEEIPIMMSATYEQHELPGNFTFRIVEAVKRIRIPPVSRTAGLPWGLSLATGIVITILSLSPHLSIPRSMANPIDSQHTEEMNVMEVGEIPVNMLSLASKHGDSDSAELEPSEPHNSASVTTTYDGEATWTQGTVAEITGKDGAPMALIPAGEFQMGSNDGGNDEKPVHTVYLDAFYIDKYEVTNALYKEFMDATGHSASPGFHSSRYNAPNQPVALITWGDAKAYAKWAGKRLPTEAEWEKAARGGLARKKYPWGDDITHDDANYDGAGGNDRWEYTAPVGSFAPNGYGLYDMAGNVGEWCADWYDEDYYSNSPRRNPKGPHLKKYIVANHRVLRGGSWGDTPSNLRVAGRSGNDPAAGYNSYGFRCAKDLKP